MEKTSARSFEGRADRIVIRDSVGAGWKPAVPAKKGTPRVSAYGGRG
jgi:hypothetical protein